MSHSPRPCSSKERKMQCIERDRKRTHSNVEREAFYLFIHSPINHKAGPALGKRQEVRNFLPISPMDFTRPSTWANTSAFPGESAVQEAGWKHSSQNWNSYSNMVYEHSKSALTYRATAPGPSLRTSGVTCCTIRTVPHCHCTRV